MLTDAQKQAAAMLIEQVLDAAGWALANGELPEELTGGFTDAMWDEVESAACAGVSTALLADS